MNRVIAVTATLATATAATMVAAATIVPAQAAPLPAAVHAAAHASTAADAKPVAQQARTASSLPTVIGSELGGGKYVTVVRCQGTESPPPITLNTPETPLMVNGGGQSAAILKMLKQSDPYKTIYTCVVTVETKVLPKPKPAAHQWGCEIKQGSGRETWAGGGRKTWAGGGRKGCTKPVTLNTGFGGWAPKVSGHHPAR